MEVPAVDAAAIRALRRAREETRRDRKAAKLRRQAFVRRHASRSTGRATWSPAPRRWLSEGRCPTLAPQMVVQADVQTVTAQTARCQRLAHALHAQGHPWRCAPVVEALQALRGVQCTVAVTTVAARGDLTRCDTPRQRLHALGLTPSESSRGGRRHQGGMTKAGHTQARRARVAGAWAYRYPATGSRHLPRRLAKRPAALQAISGKAQVRLCTRSRPLRATGNHAHQGVGAMARAWRALLWAMAKHVAVSPQAERRLLVAAKALQRASVSRQRRSPGGVDTLGGVRRPQGTLVPRVRQAPDGDTEGGNQPTDISMINRRVFLAPALPRETGKKMMQT